MPYLLKPLTRLLAASLILFSTHLVASTSVKLPGPLIGADWLIDNHEHVVVLDVRKDVDSFTKEGHIPAAALVNAKTMRVKRKQGDYELVGMLPDRKSYEGFMSAHGVTSKSTVIITNRGDTPGQAAGAARLYWQIKYYGFDQVALLDGGNRAWIEALGDITTDETPVNRVPFTSGEELGEILATTADVEQALTNKNVQLVDSRDMMFHIGLKKRDYVAEYGHIPGSLTFPYMYLYPEKGATAFNSIDIINQTLMALRIDPDKEMILYCNSGYECSSIWFAVYELLGKKNIRVYDGALNEWTMDSNHPMTRELTR